MLSGSTIRELSSNTDGFEKVNNLSDKLLANIGETTKENVSELVSCVNDLLLCGAKECNMIKLKHYNKKTYKRYAKI